MPFSAFSAAGVAAIQMGIVDLNGIPMGTAGSLVTATPTPLVKMPFAKRFGGQAPNPVRVTPTGNNNRDRHEYLFNPAQSSEIAITQHALDLDQYVGQLGIKKVTDGNGYAVGVQTNAPVNAKQAVIVVNVDAQIAGTSALYGGKRFVNEIYPLTTLTPLLANLQEVAAAEWQFFGVPTQAGQLPWGTPFSIATHGFTRSCGYLIGSDYPLVIESYKATGAETTFDLTYTPATPMATYVLAWKFASGTWASFSLSSLSGKTLTFSALTAGDIIEVRYEATDILQAA